MDMGMHTGMDKIPMAMRKLVYIEEKKGCFIFILFF